MLSAWIAFWNKRLTWSVGRIFGIILGISLLQYCLEGLGSPWLQGLGFWHRHWLVLDGQQRMARKRRSEAFGGRGVFHFFLRFLHHGA